MINEKEIEAWVLSLKIDKQYGIGVETIYTDRKEDRPQGVYCIDIVDLNELDIMLISRMFGEAVWCIDEKLWTRESLAKAEDEEFKNDADVQQYFDIEPYTPLDLETICLLNPTNKLKDYEDDDYTTKETEWYKNLREKFDNSSNLY